MSEKDYSLLRPFDLDAVKQGEAICTDELVDVKYVDGPDQYTNVVVKAGGYFILQCHRLRMSPLCWVEGRPVYKGDRLWHKAVRSWIEITAYFNGGIENNLQTNNGLCHSSNLTWTPPKVKREGWGVMRVGRVSGTREEAEAILKQYDGSNIFSDTLEGKPRVVRIEWEEPQ